MSKSNVYASVSVDKYVESHVEIHVKSCSKNFERIVDRNSSEKHENKYCVN
jgi:hypothetical protein